MLPNESFLLGNLSSKQSTTFYYFPLQKVGESVFTFVHHNPCIFTHSRIYPEGVLQYDNYHKM